MDYTKKNKTIWIILFVITSLLIYAANRGLGFTDEGLFCLLTNPIQNVTYSPINYDILYKYIFKFSGYEFDIFSLRILRIATTLIGSFILFIGLKEYFNRTQIELKNPLRLLAFTLIIGFWNYLPYLIQTPGYSYHHFFAIQLFAGTLLFFIYRKNRSPYIVLFASVLIVLAVLISWLAKPTGLPAMLCVLVGMIYYNRRYINLKSLILFIITSLALCIYFFIFSDFTNRVSPSMYLKVLKILQSEKNTHSLDFLMLRLVRDLFILSLAIFSGFLTSYLIKIRKIYSAIIYISIILIGIISELIYASGKIILQGDITIESFVIYRLLVYTPLFVGLVAGYFIRFNELKKEQLILALFLLLMVSCYSFGSNSNNLFSAISTFQFIFLGIYILIPKKLVARFILLGSFGLLLAIFCGLIFPFHQVSIFNNKYEYKYGSNLEHSILLDEDSYNDQININKIIKEYKTSNIIGYKRMPSYIYLASKISPGSPFWGEEDVKYYFSYRFNQPDNFLLFIENRQNEQFLFNFLKTYNLKYVAVVKIKSHFNQRNSIYIYYCTKIKQKKT